MKSVNIIIFIFISTNLFGQNSTNIKTNDSILKEFNSFLNIICNGESDSLLNCKDSLINYRVVFSSQGDFIDPKSELIRLCNYKNIIKENYSAEVIQLNNSQDSLRNYYWSSSCQPIKTCLINNYLGETLEDSLVNIQSEPSFWATCVIAKEIRFPKDIILRSLSESINNHNVFANPSIMSYKSGKYLIVDMIMATQIGSQTDSGHIQTYYLERKE
jgi:hypothetical protein